MTSLLLGNINFYLHMEMKNTDLLQVHVVHMWKI